MHSHKLDKSKQNILENVVVILMHLFSLSIFTSINIIWSDLRALNLTDLSSNGCILLAHAHIFCTHLYLLFTFNGVVIFGYSI